MMKSNLSNTGDIEKNNENGKLECVGRKESQEIVNEDRNVVPDTNMNDIINAKGAIGSQTGSIDKEIVKLIFEIGELSDNINLNTTFDEIELDSIELFHTFRNRNLTIYASVLMSQDKIVRGLDVNG